jgi:hypothetical protein
MKVLRPSPAAATDTVEKKRIQGGGENPANFVFRENR